jgi:hypothetical protein
MWAAFSSGGRARTSRTIPEVWNINCANHSGGPVSQERPSMELWRFTSLRGEKEKTGHLSLRTLGFIELVNFLCHSD